MLVAVHNYRLMLNSPPFLFLPFLGQDEHSHAKLAEEFKLHTIRRVYISLTCGVPNPNSGRIEASIARDPNNRIRMIATAGSGHRYARHAASR